MKWSKYNIYVPAEDNKVLVFNTLTRSYVNLNFLPDQVFDSEKKPETFAAPEILKKLQNLGVVVNESIDESLIFRNFLGAIRNDARGLGLFISLTPECNFSCSYCYESFKDNNNHAGKSSILTSENWQKIFQFIKKRIQNNSLQTLDVTFYGGEPMMAYNLLLVAAQELKNLSSDNLTVSLSLITNGSLVDTSRSEALGKLIDFVQITIDGIHNEHDSRRPFKDGTGSFSAVMKNLSSVVKDFKDVSVRINVDENNYKNMEDVLEHLKITLSENLPAVGFSWLFPTQKQISNMEIENVQSTSHDPRMDSQKVKIIHELQKMALRKGFIVATNFVDGPCSMLTSNAFTIDEKLQVYKCPGLLYEKPVGLIDNGVLEIYDNYWYEAITLEPDCIYSCVYGPICFGGCFWMAGGLDKTLCKKRAHTELLNDAIKIHAATLQRKKNGETSH